jgi:acetylornithine deacetylase/succinyl-diaminopimelate desuccinylase-like protein
MKDVHQLLDLSRRYRDYTASNLSELVKIKSPSLGEKEVAGKLAEQMQAAGFDEVTIDGLGNVIGRIGSGRRYGMEKYYPTWKWPEDHPAIQAGARTYQALFSRPPRIGKWTFSTNAVTISGVHGIPAIGFGPGAEAMAHAPDEKTPVEDLVNGAAFYSTNDAAK